jgi:hypothetical protein
MGMDQTCVYIYTVYVLLEEPILGVNKFELHPKNSLDMLLFKKYGMYHGCHFSGRDIWGVVLLPPEPFGEAARHLHVDVHMVTLGASQGSFAC